MYLHSVAVRTGSYVLPIKVDWFPNIRMGPINIEGIRAHSVLCKMSIKSCNPSMLLKMRMRGYTPAFMEGLANESLYERVCSLKAELFGSVWTSFKWLPSFTICSMYNLTFGAETGCFEEVIDLSKAFYTENDVATRYMGCSVWNRCRQTVLGCQ